MTAAIGFYFTVLILVMVPLVFLFAGVDTTHQRAERKQCQKDALLDWTDKDLLAAEHGSQSRKKAEQKSVRTSAAIEVISRDSATQAAA